MQAHRPLLTQHRRQRLVLWALAMLTWVEAVLFGNGNVTWRQLHQRCERLSLHGLARMVLYLIILRASDIAGRRRRKLRFWKYGRDLRRSHLMRSLVGSKLRRALKHRDLATRIAKLIAALRNLDAHARPLAQRMRRRLTRLWAITPTASPAEALVASPASAPAYPDSS